MTPQPSQSDPLTDPTFPPPLMVDTLEARDRLIGELEGIQHLAVDTEANSLHAYQGQVCLIQLSTDKLKLDALVDPLALNRTGQLDFLGAILADSSVEKVLHAAEYDVMILHRDFGFYIHNLFDTMIAARVLGWERFGLGSILKDRYGVKVNKRHQRANWGRRPLPADLVRYARMDTHYLLDLRDDLAAMLAEAGRTEEAAELFEEVTDARWSGNGFDPEGYWSINGARDLPPKGRAVLRELYLFREDEAKRRDVPTFKVMGDKTLMALAETMPRSTKQLNNGHKLSGLQRRRYGRDVVDAVRRGMAADPPSPPRRSGSPPDENTLHLYDVLHTWRKERGIERGVASDIIASRDALWELAHKAPHTPEELAQIESLGPWRKQAYGEEILRVIAEAEQE